MIMKNEMDKIYGTLSPDKIPWNEKSPPVQLIDLITNEFVSPCDAIDLGCGAGNYAIYLASQGFKMTGIDISSAAIKLAKANAKKNNVQIHFLEADLTLKLENLPQKFDFAYDWEVLHHIFPDQRQQYIENVNYLLNPGGKYLSVCFNEGDPQFGGEGKLRKTSIGTILYFSSEDELNALFDPFFTILEQKTVEIQGKGAPHLANYFFMEKKALDD
jgi:SAM-dependent methyltransferase